VSPATDGDHGTPAIHAAESKKNVEASKTVKGFRTPKRSSKPRTMQPRVRLHGTPVIHAAEAQWNVNASKGTAKPLASDKAAQEAVAKAVNGAKK
jgi:hypothetical protein